MFITLLCRQARRPSALRKVASPGGAASSIEDFDRKLGETDGYLELLLAQVASLKVKAESPDQSEEARARYERVLVGAQEMAESVKHAIVLLQIAKNAAVPETPNAVKDLSHVQKQQQQQKVLGQDSGETDSDAGEQADGGHTVAAPSSEVVATMVSPPKVSSSASLKPDKKSTGIPEISYSSSDDDDDFFDAEEEDEDEADAEERGGGIVGGIPLDLNLDTNPTSAVESDNPDVLVQSPLTPRTDLNEADIDYDALYAAADDDEDVDMKSHGSVITHLLSQVRIGMDLTKIVLPTFILERRSLLEMYSDFFAHPDLFVGIPEGRTPEDRMVRVLRWYLSSFHAGRKSSIAKKPYNPIIGETFRCHWTGLPDVNGVGEPMPDGPLPWTGSNELTFIAEQVSHHPPISGFYAEYPAKKLSVNAHIYTKSSFLGMSVRVTK